MDRIRARGPIVGLDDGGAGYAVMSLQDHGPKPATGPLVDAPGADGQLGDGKRNRPTGARYILRSEAQPPKAEDDPALAELASAGDQSLSGDWTRYGFA